MSVITECLPATPIAVSSVEHSVAYEQLQTISIAVACDTLATTVYLFSTDDVAVSASIADYRTTLLNVNVAVASSAIQIAHMLDLMPVTVAVSSSSLSFVYDLRGVSIAVADAFATQQITALSQASIAVAVAALQSFIVKQLATSTVGVASAVLLEMHDLAAVSVAVAALALQTQTFIDLAVSSSIAVSSIGLDQRTNTDLADVDIAVVSAAIQTMHALDLMEADICMNVRTFDTLDTGTMIWTANTDTFAMSRYPVGDLMLGVATGAYGTFFGAENNVYLRTGNQDPQGPAWGFEGHIEAYLKTGLMDFGVAALKRFDKMYCLYTSQEGIQIDVGETSTGAEITYTYTAPAMSKTAMKPTRVDMGRGAKTRMLRFTVRNIEGDALSLRGFVADLLDSTRRI